jgi:hypothetical protein
MEKVELAVPDSSLGDDSAAKSKDGHSVKGGPDSRGHQSAGSIPPLTNSKEEVRPGNASPDDESRALVEATQAFEDRNSARIAEPADRAPEASDTVATVEVEAATVEDHSSTTEVATASDPYVESAASTVDQAAEDMTLDGVRTFADFITLLSQANGEFKPVVLMKRSSARKSIANAVDIAQFDDRIADVAARDLKLSTALSLMITADKSELSGFARQTVTALCAQIVGHHPAFTDDDTIQDRLARLQSSDGGEHLLSLLITRMINRIDGDFDGKAVLKTPAAVVTLRDNAIHTVVLIAASAAKWSQLQLVDALAEHVWGAGSSLESTINNEKLVTLSKPSRKNAALIVDTFRSRIRHLENDLSAEQSRLDAATKQNEALAANLSDSRSSAALLQNELDDVRTTLQAEVDSRRSEKMAATGDFETLRVDTARNIAEQVESLEDALDALQHDQAQVTEEFVRRAVTNLRRGLARLQPRATSEGQGEKG